MSGEAVRKALRGDMPKQGDSAREGKLSAAAAAARFLRSWRLVLRLVRLYDSSHPRVRESLEDAGRELRAAVKLASPLGLVLSRDAVRLRGHALPDNSGELAALADDLLRRGVSSLVFFAESDPDELRLFAQLLESARRGELPDALPAVGAAKEAPLVNGSWNRLLDARQIQGIRVNVPAERFAAAFAPCLLAALSATAHPEGDSGDELDAEGVASSVEGLYAGLHLLERIGPALVDADPRAAKKTIHTIHLSLLASPPRAQRLLIGAIGRHQPDPKEVLEPYFHRLAESLVLDFCRAEFDSRKLSFAGLRQQLLAVVHELTRPAPAGTVVRQPDWFGEPGQEAGAAERLLGLLWEGLPARDKSAVLRGADAWCIPVSMLRPYLQLLIGAGGASEARFLLLNYARAVESGEESVRRTAATGLHALDEVIEQLWPQSLSEELCRCIARALAVERSPELTASLSTVADLLARLALRAADWQSYEAILDCLEPRRHDAARSPAAALAERMLTEGHWNVLVDAALSTSESSPSLPRILGRNPERLLDRLGTLLADPGGLDLLPAMARLLTAVGEPAIGALAGRLGDPRAQRAAVAVKLLAATEPPRLVSALPSVLPSWEWSLQDLAVSELARLGPPGSGRALLDSLPDAHPMVAPLMLDQIGLLEETAAVPALVQIAAGQQERLRDIFVRIKAVEALGRLRAREAAEVLRGILRQRNGLTHAEPPGLRAAAVEAIGLIENWPSSARVRKAQQALAKASVSFTRPRRYLRISLVSPMVARIKGDQRSSVRVRSLSLGGAYVESRQRLQVGQSFPMEIRAGVRRIRSRAVVRNVSPGGGGIEFVHMNPRDRERLRRLVNRLLRG